MEETIKKLREEEERLQAMLSSKMEEKAKQEEDLGKTNEEIEKAQKIIRSQEQLRETREKEKEEIESDIKRIQEVVREMERKKASLERQEEIKKRRKELQEKKIKEAKKLRKDLEDIRKKEKEIEAKLDKLESNFQISIKDLGAEETEPETELDLDAIRDAKLRGETIGYFHNQKDGEYVDWKEIEDAKRLRNNPRKPGEKPDEKPDYKPDEKPDEKPDHKPTPKKITPSNPEEGKPLPPKDETKRKGFVSSMIDKVRPAVAFIIDRVKKLPDFVMDFLKLEDDEIFDEDLAGQVQGIMEEERKDQAYKLRQLVNKSNNLDPAERRRKEPALEAMHKRREEKRNTGPIPNIKAEAQNKSWELPNGEKLKVVKGTNQVGQEAAIKEALATYDRDSRYPIEPRRTGGRELVEE